MRGLGRALTTFVVVVVVGLLALRIAAPDAFHGLMSDAGFTPATSAKPEPQKGMPMAPDPGTPPVAPRPGATPLPQPPSQNDQPPPDNGPGH